MSEVAEVLEEAHESAKLQVREDAAVLLSLLDADHLCNDAHFNKEEGVVYYIAKSLLKKTKCGSCSTVLVKSLDTPNFDIDESDCDVEEKMKKETFLNIVDRGGLVTPSDLVYLICLHGLQLKAEIFDGGKLQEKFLACGYPRAVFVKIFERKIYNTDSEGLFSQMCDEGHNFMDFIPIIVAKFFNCVSKNFIATVNDQIHAARKRRPQMLNNNSNARKLSKLQSM